MAPESDEVRWLSLSKPLESTLHYRHVGTWTRKYDIIVGYDKYLLGALTLLGAILGHSLHPCSLVHVQEALFHTSAVARPKQSKFFESFIGFEIVVPFSYFPRLDLVVP